MRVSWELGSFSAMLPEVSISSTTLGGTLAFLLRGICEIDTAAWAGRLPSSMPASTRVSRLEMPIKLSLPQRR
ncbi:hypothetical protein D3C81_1882460 [compost metagenome]